MHQSSADPIVSSNLRLALEKSGRSAYAVAIAVDHAPNWLYRVLKGKAGILIPTLREVANELGVSAGSLLDSPNEVAAKVRELDDAGALAADGDADGHDVDVMELDTAAGTGAVVDFERVKDRIKFRRSWLRKHGLVASQCKVIGVKGESMEPTLVDGCSILIDRNRRSRRVGRIYVVRTDDGLIVKRAGKSRAGHWQLVSDHPDKQDWPTLRWPDNAEVIGEVKWAARTF